MLFTCFSCYLFCVFAFLFGGWEVAHNGQMTTCGPPLAPSVSYPLSKLTQTPLPLTGRTNSSFLCILLHLAKKCGGVAFASRYALLCDLPHHGPHPLLISHLTHHPPPPTTKHTQDVSTRHHPGHNQGATSILQPGPSRGTHSFFPPFLPSPQSSLRPPPSPAQPLTTPSLPCPNPQPQRS